MRGNCYVTCEALYHLLGGKESGYKPMTVRHEGDVHWFLVFEGTKNLGYYGLGGCRVVIDPTVSQFKTKPDYNKGRGRGFLTKKPSTRALMKTMLWQKT